MKCIYKKENDESCNANAMKGVKYCYLHNPDIPEEDKFNAQSNGGKANKIKIYEPLEPIKVKTPSDVVSLLEDTINRVRSGEMDLKVANCIGYLSGHITKALEIAELEKRLDAVERAVISR